MALKCCLQKMNLISWYLPCRMSHSRYPTYQGCSSAGECTGSHKSKGQNTLLDTNYIAMRSLWVSPWNFFLWQQRENWILIWKWKVMITNIPFASCLLSLCWVRNNPLLQLFFGHEGSLTPQAGWRIFAELKHWVYDPVLAAISFWVSYHGRAWHTKCQVLVWHPRVGFGFLFFFLVPKWNLDVPLIVLNFIQIYTDHCYLYR